MQPERNGQEAPSRERMRRRRRRSAVLLLLLIASGLVVVDLFRGSGGDAAAEQAPPPPVPAARPDVPAPVTGAPSPAAPSPSPSPVRVSRAAIVLPQFSYADGPGRVLGRAGALRRFRVAVERGVPLETPTSFAAAVDAVLGDRRSWVAAGTLRFQRVARTEPADFTVFLATAATSERMCAQGGLDTEGYTSCRLPGRVIINLTRWTEAVPGYGAPLTEYRSYAINHEVGHQLGNGHEACPGQGRPAPVMQQQTLGLAGCLANGWPYRDGRRYAGAAIR